MRLLSVPPQPQPQPQPHPSSSSFFLRSLSIPGHVRLIRRRSIGCVSVRILEKAATRARARACAKSEEENDPGTVGGEWGKVSAVLFDMDGVLCNSEELSRLAAVDLFAKMGVEVTAEDFVPFMGTGYALRFFIYISHQLHHSVMLGLYCYIEKSFFAIFWL